MNSLNLVLFSSASALQDGKTAFFHAVDRNQLEIASALLDAKANVELAAKDSENCDTPLLRAVRNRNVELTDLLIHKAKAKVQVVDNVSRRSSFIFTCVIIPRARNKFIFFVEICW